MLLYLLNSHLTLCIFTIRYFINLSSETLQISKLQFIGICISVYFCFLFHIFALIYKKNIRIVKFILKNDN